MYCFSNVGHFQSQGTQSWAEGLQGEAQLDTVQADRDRVHTPACQDLYLHTNTTEPKHSCDSVSISHLTRALPRAVLACTVWYVLYCLLGSYSCTRYCVVLSYHWSHHSVLWSYHKREWNAEYKLYLSVYLPGQWAAGCLLRRQSGGAATFFCCDYIQYWESGDRVARSVIHTEMWPDGVECTLCTSSALFGDTRFVHILEALVAQWHIDRVTAHFIQLPVRDLTYLLTKSISPGGSVHSTHASHGRVELFPRGF